MKIIVEQLKEGLEEKIKNKISPSFIDVKEEALEFLDDVEIEGKTYTTSEHLILHLKILTYATMPCSICNTKTKVEICIKNFYHAEELVSINQIFDYSNVLREAILLEVPSFTECHNKNCPERKEISYFLKKSDSNFPFANLK